jgi:hypothetical protein
VILLRGHCHQLSGVSRVNDVVHITSIIEDVNMLFNLLSSLH